MRSRRIWNRRRTPPCMTPAKSWNTCDGPANHRSSHDRSAPGRHSSTLLTAFHPRPGGRSTHRYASKPSARSYCTSLHSSTRQDARHRKTSCACCTYHRHASQSEPNPDSCCRPRPHRELLAPTYPCLLAVRGMGPGTGLHWGKARRTCTGACPSLSSCSSSTRTSGPTRHRSTLRSSC
jgi:hypothetical protein